MPDIYWTREQRRHIEKRHGVTAQDFEEAWDDPNREDLAEEEDPVWGPYKLSMGCTSGGRIVEMVWRWQGQGQDEGTRSVWPITAYFRSPPERRSRRRGRSGKE